jgi:glycerophosphoryl diester phosphodiesterase
MGSWFSPFLFAGERMITLDDLFATYGGDFTYHVEVKGKADALPAAVYACIERHNMRTRCFVTSFRHDALVAMRELDSTLRLGWLVQEINAETIAKAGALQLYQLCPIAKSVSAAQVAQARTVVKEVRAWGLQGATVGNHHAELIALIQQVLECGCDGMTINWPDWVRSE